MSQFSKQGRNKTGPTLLVGHRWYQFFFEGKNLEKNVMSFQILDHIWHLCPWQPHQSKLIAQTGNSLLSTTHIFYFFSEILMKLFKTSLKDEAKVDHIFLVNLRLHSITMFSTYFFLKLGYDKIVTILLETFWTAF